MKYLSNTSYVSARPTEFTYRVFSLPIVTVLFLVYFFLVYFSSWIQELDLDSATEE